MTREELRESNKKRRIHQIGIVVSNLEETVEAWESLYGVGPWDYFSFSNEEMTDIVNGGNAAATEKFSFRVAASMIGELQIELIEANASMPLYQDFLDRTGGGIHHFKEKVPDERMTSQLEVYEKADMATLFGGRFRNISFYYVDTMKRLGFLLELGNCERLAPP